MNNSLRFQEQSYLLNDQYKTGRNLSARAALHERYRSAAVPWPNWVFAQLALEPGSRILECGCGPGWLWRHNLQAIPPGCHITLTDLSTGMLKEAESALKESGYSLQFETADIQKLPFAAGSFEVVVANHMLYHVPVLETALAEVRRVLKNNGRFFAATNGAGHLRELWQIGRELAAEFSDESILAQNTPEDRWHLSFSLENGAEHLHPYFKNVAVKMFDDTLIVTEAEPILAYLASSISAGFPVEKWEQMKDFIQEKIDASGNIVIQKETGLFAAQ